jgi:hypothetical protein
MRRSLVMCLGVGLILAGSASAQNLLVNPGFDQGTSGWTAGSPTVTTVWQQVDADGSPGSGSVKATLHTAAPGEGFSALAQCVPVVAGTQYAFSIKVRTATKLVQPQVMAVDFVSDPACASLAGGNAFLLPVSHPGWVGAGDFLIAPPGSQSARIGLQIEDNGDLETWEYDDAFFGPAVTACTPSATTLCLDWQPGDHRFAVQATFSSPARNLGGTAQAIAAGSLGVTRGGLLSFFDTTNPELLVKVLDGCSATQNFWVFISAGTDVGVELTIADTRRLGVVYLFRSPDGQAFPNVQNVYAMPCV